MFLKKKISTDKRAFFCYRKPVLVPKTLENWLLVYVDKNEEVVRRFYKELQTVRDLVLTFTNVS